MKKRVIFLIYFLAVFCIFPNLTPFCLASNQEIQYEISFDNAVHHEARIKVTFFGLSGGPLEIIMSRSSPGYYIPLAFAKNIYDVKAYNSKGEPLELVQPDEHQWNVSGHDGMVILSYTLFADHMDGTYSSISLNQISLNIPSSFVWAKGLENVPIKLKIKKPSDNLKIVTQLVPGVKPDEFTAPNLVYFIDSPVSIADFTMEEYEVESNGKKQKFRLAVNHKGTKEEAEIYAKLVEAITYEQMGLFKELPDFDYGTYLFVTNYVPEAVFDGMEHRNSSILTSTRTLDTSFIKNLRTLSHELFHAWECERIRPKNLEPFNLEKNNISDELWFVEGFPTYYQDLVVCRAGLVNLDEYGEILKERVDYVYNYPGNNHHSLVEMSRKAVFFNGGAYEDPINKDNIYISYYSYGGVIAIGLDFMLRTKFENITLDDYLRAIWNKFGKKEVPYNNEDLKNLLSELTKNEKFADDFFKRYIYGNELPDLKNLLSYAGLQLRKKRPEKASLGRNNILKYQADTTIIIDKPVLTNEPLYAAGLDMGDIILKIDNKLIAKEEDLKSILELHKPGDIINIEFKRRSGELVTGTIKFEEDKEIEIVPYEITSLPVTPEIINFRKKWLSSKSDFHNPDLVKKDPETERLFPFEYNYCPYTGRKLLIKLRSKLK